MAEPTLVRNINRTNEGSNPQYLTGVNGTLYFSIFNDSTRSHELWKSDRTAGAVLVRSAYPGSFLSLQNLTNVDDTLYFNRTSNNGTELLGLDMLDDQKTSLSRDGQTHAIASNTGNDILTGISRDERYVSDLSPDTLINSLSRDINRPTRDRFDFNGIHDTDVEILNANTEFPVSDRMLAHSSFGIGSLQANVFDTTGLNIDNINVHPTTNHQFPLPII